MGFFFWFRDTPSGYLWSSKGLHWHTQEKMHLSDHEDTLDNQICYIQIMFYHQKYEGAEDGPNNNFGV